MIIQLALICASAAANPAERAPAQDRAAAQWTYRSRHLSVRSLHTVTPGSTVVIYDDWGWRRPYWGMGTSTVIHEPAMVVDTWAVFQGPQRLPVPQYLRLVEADRADELGRALRGTRRTRTVGTTVGLAGAGSLAVGLLGMSQAQDIDGYSTWSTVSTLGVVGAVAGLLSAAAGRGRAARLSDDYTATQEAPVVLDEVYAYNDRLRRALGLTPAEAERLQQQRPALGPGD